MMPGKRDVRKKPFMRLALLGLLLPLAACASVEPTPIGAAPEAVVVAAAGPAAKAEPNSPPNAKVQVAAEKVMPKQVCWTEIVTGTLGRRQKVCRNERTERDSAIMRKDLKTFQDRASGSQGQTLGAGGG